MPDDDQIQRIMKESLLREDSLRGHMTRTWEIYATLLTRA